jgi:hypothetical protein
MAFAGQKVLQVWHPTQPLVIKYTLPLFAAVCSWAFCSAGFTAAITPVAFNSNGDAIAAELINMNLRLVKFELFSVITSFPPVYLIMHIKHQCMMPSSFDVNTAVIANLFKYTFLNIMSLNEWIFQ